MLRHNDDEPLTDEWLRLVGAEPGRFQEDLVIGPIVRGVTNNQLSVSHGQWHWCVRSYPIPTHAQPKTREQFRQLCAALGVPLPLPELE